MRDPVTLVQSGQTYDRASWCESLLQYPTLWPKTGQHFDQKLSYINNYDTREDLTYYLGDDAYQPYDILFFKRRYEAFWREQTNASTSPSLDEVAALLFCMNRRQVDWVAAQGLVNNACHDDVVLTGFKALVFHPIAFQSSKLRKNETESLRFWRYAEVLGLFPESNVNNKWAQCLKGEYHVYASQDYASARHFYELAADQGDASAQHKLGYLYRNSLGVMQHYSKFLQACSRLRSCFGSKQSQLSLSSQPWRNARLCKGKTFLRPCSRTRSCFGSI